MTQTDSSPAQRQGPEPGNNPSYPVAPYSSSAPSMATASTQGAPMQSYSSYPEGQASPPYPYGASNMSSLNLPPIRSIDGRQQQQQQQQPPPQPAPPQQQQQQQAATQVHPPQPAQQQQQVHQGAGHPVPFFSPYPMAHPQDPGAPMRYPLPPNPDGRILSGGRHKKEIKRRTKTGCLTCRKRRIKVCLPPSANFPASVEQCDRSPSICSAVNCEFCLHWPERFYFFDVPGRCLYGYEPGRSDRVKRGLSILRFDREIDLRVDRMLIVFVLDTHQDLIHCLSFPHAPLGTHFCLRLNDLLAYMSRPTSATKVILLAETVRRAKESVLGTTRYSSLNQELQQYNLPLLNTPPCRILHQPPCPLRLRDILFQHTASSSRKKMNGKTRPRNRIPCRKTPSNKRMGSMLRP